MANRECAIDIETYSSVDIDRGVYAYADSPDFEIMLVAYKFSDEDCVKQFMPEKFRNRPGVFTGAGEQIGLDGDKPLTFDGDEREFLKALNGHETVFTAYNANFERTCLAKYYGVDCNPDEWRCTMVLASVAGLPRTLKDAGDALGLPEDEKKLRTGKALIQYFCKPVTATKSNGMRTRNLPKHDMAKWRLFCEYNLQDVVTEQAIRQRLKSFQPNASEQKLWSVDQWICDRGIRIDKPFVEGIVEHDSERQEALKEEAREITGLENPNSVAKLKEWFKRQGVPELSNDLSKEAVDAALKVNHKPNVQRMLQIRKALGKTSTAKYQAMLNSACHDDRVRGMLQFYGANRTGRWSGRIVQLQNLPQNHIPDLDLARQIVAAGDFETLELLYGETGQVLSELVRTAFIPSDGNRFVVTDFSAIEARVIAWLAGEDWRLDVFRNGGDIYCQSASQMFHVPVEKHGVNGHLRQQGKVAELACIAEGELVLTNNGEKPIEAVTLDDLLWDGESWVRHEGVIFKGVREVMCYGGLTATPDHLVWVEGESEPVFFGIAAAGCARLLQGGYGGRAVWVGEDHQPGEKMGPIMESLLCADRMPGLPVDSMAESCEPEKREIQGLPKLFAAETNTYVAGPQIDCCEAEMRESEGSRISQLRSAWNSIRFPERNRGRSISDQDIWITKQENGNRPDQHERELRARKPEIRISQDQLYKSEAKRPQSVRPEILALRKDGGNQEAVCRVDTRGDHSGCRDGSFREAEKLAWYKGEARVYDIRNAGPHHRFTVSGKLVHNCGYGGGIGAIKAMDKAGAIPEDEIQGIIDRWRDASPAIVKLWGDYEKAAILVVKKGGSVLKDTYTGRRQFKVKVTHTFQDYGEISKDVWWESTFAVSPEKAENNLKHRTEDIPCGRPSFRGEEYGTENHCHWYSYQAFESYECDETDLPPMLDKGISFEFRNGNLLVKLPSGRKITYWGAALGMNRFGKTALYYMGINQNTHKWEKVETYGGKITENIVQSVARDCLAAKLIEAHERGYEVVAHVHDEMIIDCPRANINAAKDIDSMMAEPIPWAPGLPLKGGTYECDYYQKD